MYDTIYFQAPGEKDFDSEDWDEDDDEFDDEQFEDEAEDTDDLHEIRVNDDLNEPGEDDRYDITNPDPEDDHFPEDELQ